MAKNNAVRLAIGKKSNRGLIHELNLIEVENGHDARFFALLS